MKKHYEKPDIMFDNFTMSESVANCEVRSNFGQGTCGVEMTESLTMFTNTVDVCNIKYQDGEYDRLCYDVPMDSYNVFRS
jgi:hypothetical protein